MKNKIIILAGIALVSLGVLYAIVHSLGASAKPNIAQLDSPNALQSQNLVEYLSMEPGKHVFFLDDGTEDAQYISSSLLIPLGLEFDNALPQVEPVLFEDNKISVISLKKTYDVDSLPALVYMETIDDEGSFRIISSLSYNKENPFDADDLRTWFHENKLWNAPIATN